VPKKEQINQLRAMERMELEDIVRQGSHKARVMRRAQTLLWSDAGKTDSEIGELQGTRPLTVAKPRQRWVEERSREDKPRPGGKAKLDGKQEAFLVARACSDGPDGYETWTRQLLADKLIELHVIDEPISDEPVRLRLKKRHQALAERARVHPDGEQ
jgi:hypothetical protein